MSPLVLLGQQAISTKRRVMETLTITPTGKAPGLVVAVRDKEGNLLNVVDLDLKWVLTFTGSFDFKWEREAL